MKDEIPSFLHSLEAWSVFGSTHSNYCILAGRKKMKTFDTYTYPKATTFVLHDNDTRFISIYEFLDNNLLIPER